MKPLVLALVATVAGSAPVLPQSQHIPGYRNPEVTQATIGQTICVKGWTATIRPSVSYTSYVKKQMLRYDKLPGTVSDYTLDHLISLELGGSSYDSRNLFMAAKGQAHVDDGMENRLKRDVCAGKLTLREAQRAELAWKKIQG